MADVKCHYGWKAFHDRAKHIGPDGGAIWWGEPSLRLDVLESPAAAAESMMHRYVEDGLSGGELFGNNGKELEDWEYRGLCINALHNIAPGSRMLAEFQESEAVHGRRRVESNGGTRMQPFGVGDLVRVVRQPRDLGPQIVGQVGVVEMVSKRETQTWVQIVCFSLSGKRSGEGTVPILCIERVSDSCWIKARQQYLTNLALEQKEAEEYTERYRRKIHDIATKHGLTDAVVEDIVSMLQEYET